MVVAAIAFCPPADALGASVTPQRYATEIGPGLLRLEKLDRATVRPCFAGQFRSCAAALRAEAIGARSFLRLLCATRPPATLRTAIEGLRHGLALLVPLLERAARGNDEQDATTFVRLTRRFDIAFADADGAILAIDAAAPAKLPTFAP